MTDFKRDKYGNPICETCGGDLMIFSAEPGDVQGMCPTCDNSAPGRKQTIINKLKGAKI